MTDLRGMSEEWIADHGRFLRRLSRAVLRDDSRAEDAAQEAWLAALEAPPPANFVGWLVTVTRRVGLRFDREADRRRARERSVAREERLPAADSVAARSEIVRLVGAVVAELPEPFRETLLLRYWEGLPPRRIAARMRVPVATVQSRTRRGLERVRTELEHRAPREESWRESLALAVGLRPRPFVIPMTLGALTMKAKTWIAGACALIALTVATAVGTSVLTPDGGNVEPRPAPAALGRAVGEPEPVLAAEEARPERRVQEPALDALAETATTLPVFVVDAAGQPVEGAELLAGPGADDLGVVARTDGGGRTLLEVTPELHVLCARAEGWAPSPVYDVPPLERASDGLVLQLPVRGAALAVEVRDPSGAPLWGARVFAGRDEEVDYRLPDGAVARTAPGFAARTDADGIARFPSLPPGWLRVRVQHEAYAGAMAFATLDPGGESRLEIRLEPGLTVTGRVCDERGAPVAGAMVRGDSATRSATSAADGSFRLGPVGAGKLVAVGPLGRRTVERVVGEPGTVVRWDPVLPSEPAVRGRVVDDRGQPLAGWTVHANLDRWPGWRRGATTDPDGCFVIYDAPSGALRVEVRAEPQGELPVLTREGIEAGPAELRLEVPGDPWARLVGQVERRDGGPRATLPLFLRHATSSGRERLTGGPGRAVALDADGCFDLEHVPAGSYELVLDGPPFGWCRLARFEVAPGRTTDLWTLAVPEPGILRTRTSWGAPEPTGDASFLLERRADRVRVLSFRGTFPAEMSLAPGTYTLQTEVTPGPRRELEFEIRPGQTVQVELDLASTCTHLVRVRYASGRVPRGAVSVRARRLDDGIDVLSDRISELEGDAWLLTAELPPGRIELVARDGAGLETRTTENLYTSHPGREIVLTLDDAGGPR